MTTHQIVHFKLGARGLEALGELCENVRQGFEALDRAHALLVELRDNGSLDIVGDLTSCEGDETAAPAVVERLIGDHVPGKDS